MQKLGMTAATHPTFIALCEARVRLPQCTQLSRARE